MHEETKYFLSGVVVTEQSLGEWFAKVPKEWELVPTEQDKFSAWVKNNT